MSTKPYKLPRRAVKTDTRLALSTFISGILNSSLAWMLMVLFSTEIFLASIRPLKFVHVEGTILKDQDVIGCRIDQILSRTLSENTIILGDSTGDSICIYPDIAKFKVPLTSYSWNYYLHARYAENLLSETIGIPVSIKNLSFSGCLISDQLLVVEKLLQYGNRPKLAILTVVPRPFLDTTVDPKISPIKCYFDYRFNGMEKISNFPRLFDYYLSSNSNIYRTRSDYATVASALACSTFKRRANAYERGGLTQRNSVQLFGSEKTIEPDTSESPLMVSSAVEHYRNVYKFEKEYFGHQFQCFSKMLSYLDKQGVATIVVKLPLAKKNLSLLAEGFSKAFDDKLSAELSNFSHAKLVDLQGDTLFLDSDFTDTVHLNAQGALKFWDKFKSEIKKDPDFVSKIQ